MQSINDFKNRRPEMIGETRYRNYAVLIPLIKTPGGISVLFEKRSDKLSHQPGEICFPGGRLEKNESLCQCAVRETVEELKVTPQQIDVLGPSDIFVSPFNLKIHPFIGFVKEYNGTFSKDEVAEVIKVPIEFFDQNQPERYKSKIVSELPDDFPYERIPGGENYPWANGIYDILFYQYKHYIIWGLTARIIQSAKELMDRYNLLDGIKDSSGVGLLNG